MSKSFLLDKLYRLKSSLRNHSTYLLLISGVVLIGAVACLPDISNSYNTKEAINVIAFSPDGLTIASGDDNGKVQLRDADTFHPLKTIAQHNYGYEIDLLSYSRDGKLLVNGYTSEIDVTNIDTGHLIHRFEQSAASIAISPDGGTLATGDIGIGSDPVNRSVRLWDIKTGRLRMTLKGHHHTVGSVAYSPDGKELASADKGGMVKLWDAKTGKCLSTMPYRGFYESAKVTFVPGNKLLAIVTDNFVDSGYATGGPIFHFVQTRPIDEEIKVWNVRTKEHVMTLDTQEQTAHEIAISHNGLLLASAGYKKDVQLWDLVTGRLLRSLKIPGGEVTSLKFSPNDKQIVAAIRNPNTI
ncbi:MAG: WD40 repeat domain-containing protein, partial [Abditibacteriaceae bacterium]